jgi:flavin-binding protein dodecin
VAWPCSPALDSVRGTDISRSDGIFRKLTRLDGVLPAKEETMADKVYKKINVIGCSSASYEEAIKAALAKAGESLHNLSWFEVKELRGGLGGDGEVEWQATIEVAFKVN